MPFGWGKKHEQSAQPDMSVLDTFERAMPADAHSAGPAVGWSEEKTFELLQRPLPLFTVFLAERARSSVGGGVLRFLLPETEPSLTTWNGPDGWRSDWPSLPPAVAFASDWMGRLYLLASREQLRHGEPPVAILAPTTGEFELLDYTFGEFLAEALAADWEELLDVQRLAEWRVAGGQVPEFDQCVAPKTPMMLGGSDEIDALEITSLVVAVSIGGQIWEQIKDLPEGTAITGISMD